MTEAPLNKKFSRAVVLAVTSDKGGVGKTTTTENTGYELSQTFIEELGRKPKVLIVDVDPQHNLTNGFFAHDKDPEQVKGSETIFSDNPQLSWDQVLIGGEPAEGLYISVVNSRYGSAINSVSGKPGTEQMIIEAIEYTEHDFDFIIIDTQPAPHALAKHAALAAADIILLLVIDDANSYSGAVGIGQSTSRLNDKDPDILMLQNQYQKVRKSLNSQSVEWDNAAVEAIEKYKESRAGRYKPFDFVSLTMKIPTASILSDAHSNGYPVALAKPSSPATKAFKELVRIVVEKALLKVTVETKYVI